MEGTLLPKKDTSNTSYKNYGFKTRNYPPQCKELQNFEKDLLDTIKLIKFRNVKNSVQRKPNEDILNIKSSPDVYAFADKTSNIYNYRTFIITFRITESYYMKTSPNLVKSHQPVWKNL